MDAPRRLANSSSSRMTTPEASPMTCAEAEKAVHVAEFGPLAPNRMETWPAARLMMAAGMKNGEIRRGPPSSSALCSRSIVLNPPIPDARRELGSVEPRDRPDAALPRAERFPVRPGPDAEWRHEANTRHDDSPAQS